MSIPGGLLISAVPDRQDSNDLLVVLGTAASAKEDARGSREED
jgi:hypothetical protein